MSIGIHVSKSGRTMADALRQDVEHVRGYGITAPCAQIFVSGPQSYTPTLSDEDKAAVRNYVRETGLELVVHGAYVDNPWNGGAKSISNIRNEMRTAARIGAKGVIVHLSSKASSSLAHVLTNIAKVDSATKRDVVLFLEINAAKPSAATFETPEKVGGLFHNARAIAGDPAENPDALRLGLVIDTAHLYSCGVALDTREAAQRWIERTMAALPRDTPVMFHLNDSMSELGSGRDRHAPLTSGNLWRPYSLDDGHLKIEDSGLYYLMGWAEEHGAMMILERCAADIDRDLELVSRLGFFK